MYHASGKPKGYGSEHTSIIRVPSDARVSERYGAHIRTHASLAADVYAGERERKRASAKRVRTLGVDGPRARAEERKRIEQDLRRKAGIVGNVD